MRGGTLSGMDMRGPVQAAMLLIILGMACSRPAADRVAQATTPAPRIVQVVLTPTPAPPDYRATVLAAVTPDPWPLEPSGFRNVPWGASVDEAKKVVDFTICTEPKGRESSCYINLDIGDLGIPNAFQFLDGKLDMVVLTYDPSSYETVRQALIDRYGPPLTATHETLRNAMNATFENETVYWKGSRILLSASRYMGKIDKGQAIFQVLAITERESEAAAKRRAADAAKF